jgi:hypothetical protein
MMAIAIGNIFRNGLLILVSDLVVIVVVLSRRDHSGEEKPAGLVSDQADGNQLSLRRIANTVCFFLIDKANRFINYLRSVVAWRRSLLERDQGGRARG